MNTEPEIRKDVRTLVNRWPMNDILVELSVFAADKSQMIEKKAVELEHVDGEKNVTEIQTLLGLSNSWGNVSRKLGELKNYVITYLT